MKSIPNPQHFPQAFYLFPFSSVPSSSPLADVVSQSKKMTTLNFTCPTPEAKNNLQLSHVISSGKEEKLAQDLCLIGFHSHSPSQYTFHFILLMFFITLCISSFPLVYVCSTFLHTKNNLSLTPPT